MAESGNSGVGSNWTAAERAAMPERAKRPPSLAADRQGGQLASCKRCGHPQCTCPIILADAINRWTGADYDTAVGEAERVWTDTASCRDPDTEVPTVPVQRACVFCGEPVHKRPDGQIVANKMGSNLVLEHDPSCDSSPTQRHGLP